MTRLTKKEEFQKYLKDTNIDPEDAISIFMGYYKIIDEQKYRQWASEI